MASYWYTLFVYVYHYKDAHNRFTLYIGIVLTVNKGYIQVPARSKDTWSKFVLFISWSKLQYVPESKTSPFR